MKEGQVWKKQILALLFMWSKLKFILREECQGQKWPKDLHIRVWQSYLRMDLLFSSSWYTDDKTIVETCYNRKDKSKASVAFRHLPSRRTTTIKRDWRQFLKLVSIWIRKFAVLLQKTDTTLRSLSFLLIPTF